MSGTALALVLAAAVAHALWNIIAAKASGSGLPFLFWGAAASSLIWAFAVPATGGLGSARFSDLALGVAVSGLLHVTYMIVLQRGYAAGEISTVYATARGSGPVLTVLVSILLLGERPGPLALVGVGLVVTGVVSLGLIGSRGVHSASRALGVQESGGTRRIRIDLAILYGLLTGVAIASYTVWDVHTVNGFGAAPVAFMVGTSLVQLVLFGGMMCAQGARGGREGSPRTRTLRGELRANWAGIVAFGVLSPLSYVLVLTATTLAPLSLVAPMREVSVVLVGLYGAFRHRESHPALRIAAAIVVVAGVAIIGL